MVVVVWGEERLGVSPSKRSKTIKHAVMKTSHHAHIMHQYVALTRAMT
jgi:hypothetical protein